MKKPTIHKSGSLSILFIKLINWMRLVVWLAATVRQCSTSPHKCAQLKQQLISAVRCATDT